VSRKALLSLSLLAAMPVLRADTVTASWYGDREEGRPTASGCPFRAAGLTAAHRVLPMGTVLRVERGDRSVLVLVNDRGPYIPGRQLDLSKAAAEWLGMIDAGVSKVRISVVGLEPLHCRRHG
jgi:rare lipoprotein A